MIRHVSICVLSLIAVDTARAASVANCSAGTADAPGLYVGYLCNEGTAPSARVDVCAFDAATNTMTCDMSRNLGGGAAAAATAWIVSSYGTSPHEFVAYGTAATGNGFCCVMNNDPLVGPDILTMRLLGGAAGDFLYFDDGVAFPGEFLVGDTALGYSAATPLVGDIQGLEGNDTIEGSRDNLVASYYSEVISGGADNDILYGGPLPTNNSGQETFWGGDGDDDIYAGDQDDYVFAGPGDDYIEGGEDIDEIYGHAGIDTIHGDLGADFILGGPDDDDIDGGDSDDTIHGDGGLDLIRGGDGNDTIYGESPFATSGSGDTIYGCSDAAVTCATDDDIIYGNYGFDWIFGCGNYVATCTLDDDEIYGGPGNDNLVGESGIDTLIGQDGNDRISGGLDGDTIHGNIGADTLCGGGSIDTLLGHAGADTIAGGLPDPGDVIDGGTSGADIDTCTMADLPVACEAPLGVMPGFCIAYP